MIHDPEASAASWFAEMWPPNSDFGAVVLVQRPLQTVYVPSMWWHVVYNLEFSIAITQNFAPREHFPSVWSDVVEDRSVCASLWRKQLGIHEPELLDELDGD